MTGELGLVSIKARNEGTVGGCIRKTGRSGLKKAQSIPNSMN